MKKKQITITFGGEQLKAKLEKNATTRDFIAKLPLTMTLRDLYRREKYTEINAFKVGPTNISHYSKGDISYWTPGNAFVIYYKGNQEPLHGLVKMGEVIDKVERLAHYPGDIEVTIDLVKNEEE